MILNCAKCGRFTDGKHAIPIRDTVHPYIADYDYLCSRCAAEQKITARATVPDAATEERVKKIILESLVFTNENSEPWAQLLTENILASLDGAPEPEVKK